MGLQDGREIREVARGVPDGEDGGHGDDFMASAGASLESL
jgi:GTPase involved in cell partitioning and DNA repair